MLAAVSGTPGRLSHANHVTITHSLCELGNIDHIKVWARCRKAQMSTGVALSLFGNVQSHILSSKTMTPPRFSLWTRNR